MTPSGPSMSPPTPASPPEALPRGAIACLALTAFGSGMSLRINDAMLPQLASEFGVSLGQASQVISLFAVAYGVSQLFFGPLGDRFGKYRVIAWATAACAATVLACAFAPDFLALRMARVMAGATAAAIIPLAMAWIGDVVPYEQRQPVLARFLIGQIFGCHVGRLAGRLCGRSSVLACALSAAGVALRRRQRGAVRAAIDGCRRVRVPRSAPAARPGGACCRSSPACWRGPGRGPCWCWCSSKACSCTGPFAFVASHVHQAFGSVAVQRRRAADAVRPGRADVRAVLAPAGVAPGRGRPGALGRGADVRGAAEPSATRRPGAGWWSAASCSAWATT